MADRGQTRSGRSPVVIIGGGIIGLSTAYELSLARGCGRSITIVDNAPTLLAGASGKANGILGDYDFEPEAESLGKLSWEQHRQLARVHGGWAGWGYRDVTIYDLHSAASSDSSEVGLGSTHSLSPLPAWCMSLERHGRTLVPDHEHAAARINPADFCRFLQKGCEERGVQILLNTTIVSVGIHQGSLESVIITRNNKTKTMKCHSLVIAAGAWSERVLSGLFPNSRVRIPSNKQPSSGNYIILKAPIGHDRQDTTVCHQIYLEKVFGHKVDISSRPDGTLYIGGSLSAQEAIPETTTDVQPQSKYVFKMMRLVARVLGCSPDDVEILDIGRAYRPCLEQGRPIISHIPLDKLLGMTHRNLVEEREVERGGVYLNVGHGWDGITLGPGSGKVMSELIEGGQAVSADISGLGIL